MADEAAIKNKFDDQGRVTPLGTLIALVFPLHQTVRLTDFMMKKTVGFSEDTVDNAASPVGLVAPPRPLALSLSPRSLRAISAAEAAFDKLVRDHEVSLNSFQPFCLKVLGLMLLSMISSIVPMFPHVPSCLFSLGPSQDGSFRVPRLWGRPNQEVQD